jgi:hypothetical protein
VQNAPKFPYPGKYSWKTPELRVLVATKTIALGWLLNINDILCINNETIGVKCFIIVSLILTVVLLLLLEKQSSTMMPPVLLHAILGSVGSLTHGVPQPSGLRVEHRLAEENVVWVDHSQPRFSWGKPSNLDLSWSNVLCRSLDLSHVLFF